MNSKKRLASAELYAIGWITALPLELAAATAMFDEEHDRPEGFEKHGEDENTYDWGRIGSHNVVVASLPAGRYGTAMAAITAHAMRFSLPHIRVGLLVGIGAGIWSEEHDIRLGDVVISQPRDKSGGVVQYDLAKATGGQLKRTGFTGPPPSVLLRGLAKLEAAHIRAPSKMPAILNEMLVRFPHMAKPTPKKPGFVHQGSDNDRLFNASYKHAGGKTCDSCDQAEEKKRQTRDSTTPELHYGLIASGNLLVKDADIRDSIVAELEEDILCFEMEAAGLMDSFPCLVIRGVCDYADSHKNDRWQNYAAACAAASAKELLIHIDGQDIQRTPKIGEVLQKIDEINSKVDEFYHKQIYDWLSAADPLIDHNIAIAQRHEGSGSWFLKSQTFDSWKSGLRRFLWLKGIPGCGKTILSSAIIEDLKSNLSTGSTVLLSFYFNFSDTTKQQTVESTLRSLVKQLARKSEGAFEELNKLYKSCSNGNSQLSQWNLADLFDKMTGNFDRIWLVLDALDECSTRRNLLGWIKKLLERETSRIQIIVTSRQDQEFESAFANWINNDMMVSMDASFVDPDIQSYVLKRTYSEEGFVQWRGTPEILQDIVAKVVKNARGMFRLASNQLDELADSLDLDELQEKLRTLPQTLNDMYATILDRIPHQRRAKCIRLLQFLTRLERPLRIEEAVDVVAVNLGINPHFDPSKRMPIPRDVARLCSSLVTVVKANKDGLEKEELRLAHYSVKEYLVSDRVEEQYRLYLSEMEAAACIAQVCLAYLLHCNKVTGEQIWNLPFGEYAAKNWMSYARLAENNNRNLRTLIRRFFSDTESFREWQQYAEDDIPEYLEEPPLLSQALYYASLGGLERTVSRLIDKGADVQDMWGIYQFPLIAACSEGHKDVAELLLERDADVDAVAEDMGTALAVACSIGNEDIAKLLLEWKADPNIPTDSTMLLASPLAEASSAGNERLVQMLLDHGADVHIGEGIHISALVDAARSGHENVVRLLLAHGAGIGVKPKCQGSAIRIACYEGHEKVVETLLTPNADINSDSEYLGSALQIACLYPHTNIVRMLLEAGADAGSRGGRFGYPLHIACFNGNEDIVEMLLNEEINNCDQHSYFSRAFHIARILGRNRIVEKLHHKIGQLCDQIVHVDRGGSNDISCRDNKLPLLVDKDFREFLCEEIEVAQGKMSPNDSYNPRGYWLLGSRGRGMGCDVFDR